MKSINPKYTWREWLITPAYEKAEEGDYGLIKELQAVLDEPYEEQSLEIQKKYDRLKPKKFFGAGGVSHYSCSSWNKTKIQILRSKGCELKKSLIILNRKSKHKNILLMAFLYR